MQNYRPKTMLAVLGDRLLKAFFSCAAGIVWFVFLWDVSLPAIAAGLALGGLIWLCMLQFDRMGSAKRQIQLRRTLGGELALKSLLTEYPEIAAKTAASWLAQRTPLVIQRADGWMVTGTYEEKTFLLQLLAQHESQMVSVQQVVEFARIMKTKKVPIGFLCLTAPASKEAILFASEFDPPIRLVSRSEMMELAGLCHPATDEDLQKAKHRNRRKHKAAEWRSIILSAERSKRYFWYGVSMGALALLTGKPFYPIPALLCLALCAASRMQSVFSRMRTRSQAQSTVPPRAPRREP